MKEQKNQLIITRIFDVPRNLLWQAWTDPAIFQKWWGPKGFTTPVCKIDLRVGGTYLNCMRSPEGKDYWSTGRYQEIIPYKRLKFTDSFADAEGNVVSAAYYGMNADFPLELKITVIFEEITAKTKLTLTHLGIPSGKDYDDCQTGWNQSFDKLAEYKLSEYLTKV